MEELRSAKELKNFLLKDADFQEKVRQNPEAAIKGLNVGNPLDTDPWIYRLVVFFLGLTVLVAVLAGIILPMNKIENIPQILVAIGSAAVGALAGLLAPSPTKK